MISILLLSMVLLVFISVAPSTLAAPSAGDNAAKANKQAFTDLATDSPMYPFIRYLDEKGIMKGFPDGSFRPQEGVTRAQAARVMVLVKGLPEVRDGTPSFNDVPAEHWAFGAIEAAAKTGLIKGYPDGSFHPEGVITRAEAITLLMNLSGGKLSTKRMDIGDVGPDHWAYHQVVTAVDSGLAKLSADKLFNPERGFNRGEMAKRVGVMFTLSPTLRPADLTGVVKVIKGRATVTEGSGTPHEISAGAKVGVGDKLITGDQSQVEIDFDDGSGILLTANTEIEITRSNGFKYMRPDGSSGVAVDKLVISLKRGDIFGALASRYEGVEKTDSLSKIPTATNASIEEGKIFGALASRYERVERTDFLSKIHTATNELTEKEIFGTLVSRYEGSEKSGVIETAALEETVPAETSGEVNADGENTWWKEPYTERVRLEVDMPWGVTGIRGTFWHNGVSASGQSSTALIIGSAVVTSGGETVSLSGGQSTLISSGGAPPSPPAPLTQTEQQAFAAVQDWVTQQAQEIQNNLPPQPAPVILPPVTPVNTIPSQQQNQNIVTIITQALSQATAGVSPSNPTSPPNHSSSPERHSQNQAPSAVNDIVVLNQDTSTSIAVLANDTDPDGDSLTITAFTQGTHGIVAQNGSSLRYTPSAGYAGPDSFTYTISDGRGGTSSATVNVTVNPANHAPTAGNDSASVNEDNTVSIDVLVNDGDIDDDIVTITGFTQGSHGTVAQSSNGAVTQGNDLEYTPAPNYNGTDSFTYTISDGHGGTATATVNVTINPVNDPPTAANDSATVNEDGTVTINVLTNDSDVEGDNLTITGFTQGAHGTVAQGNGLEYTPAANFNGTDSFTYTISDGNGGTATATVNVTVNPVNDAPVANNDSATVIPGNSVLINVLGNDSDVDGDSLTLSGFTQGIYGTVTQEGSSLRYTATNYSGPDSFNYAISDGHGGTATATVNVTVNLP